MLNNRYLFWNQVSYHITPRKLGGEDGFSTLCIVSVEVHRAIHASKPDTLNQLRKKFDLSPEQLGKLHNVRFESRKSCHLKFKKVIRGNAV